jgi:hypothetical protein
MKFSKKEREELKNLSMQLFGSSSKWQKLLKASEFRAVLETKENPLAKKYVSLGNSKKEESTGTVLTLEKAINKGYFKSEKGQKILEEINARPVKQVSSRQPTFEELRDSLIDNIDIQKLAMCDQHEMATIVAYRLIKDILKMTILLDITEEERPSFNQILATLPEDLQERIKKLVPEKDQEKNPSAYPVNGLEMIKEMVYALKDMDAAAKEYVSILNEKNITKSSNQNLIEGLPIDQYINQMRRKTNALKKYMQLKPEYYKEKQKRELAKQQKASEEVTSTQE